jgi:hypothetical protein
MCGFSKTADEKKSVEQTELDVSEAKEKSRVSGLLLITYK